MFYPQGSHTRGGICQRAEDSSRGKTVQQAVASGGVAIATTNDGSYYFSHHLSESE